MEKVWLATKYYLDDKLIGCSAATERMFTRLVAFCGDNETGGITPPNAHIRVGLPRGKNQVDDLINRGVLQPLPCQKCAESGTETEQIVHTFGTDRAHICRCGQPARHQFNGWQNWNSQMDDLQKRKKADRERKRRQRETDDECHVTSHVTSRPQSKSKRREERDIQVEVHTHLSTGRDDERRGPAIPIDAWTLIRRVIPREHSQATKTALALEASALLVAGTPEPDVEAALALWLTKPNLGPRVLPHLISDVIRSRAPTTGAATAKAQGWLDIANQAANLDQQKAIE